MKVQERRLAKLEGANASALSLSFELRRWLGEQSRPDGVSRLPTPDDDGTGFDVAPELRNWLRNRGCGLES